jgi:hypothetical protein
MRVTFFGGHMERSPTTVVRRIRVGAVRHEETDNLRTSLALLFVCRGPRRFAGIPASRDVDTERSHQAPDVGVTLMKPKHVMQRSVPPATFGVDVGCLFQQQFDHGPVGSSGCDVQRSTRVAIVLPTHRIYVGTFCKKQLNNRCLAF